MADAVTTIMGPTPCRDCKAPVSVVTRTVEVPCDPEPLPCGCEAKDHTHAIPDVAWTVVDADGERHLCPVDTARYDAGDGSSVASENTSSTTAAVSLDPVLRPFRAREGLAP